jgi:hypothetical protein
MVKRIIVLAVCFMLSVVAACAQRDIVYIERDSVEIALKNAPSFETQRYVYGLYKNKKEILPVVYDMVEERSAELLAFFKDTEILVYDTSGSLVDRAVLEYPIDRHVVVKFEQIDGRRCERMYELVIYYNDNDWIYQPIGTYYRKGRHLYKVFITTEFELVK